MSLRVVRSSTSSGTSHIVPEGWTDPEKLFTACGTELKKTKNTSIAQAGHVTCMKCVTSMGAKW